MNIIPFIFDTLPVRAVLRDGEPWFVAADVCAVLEIVDVRQAVERLDDSERGGCTVPTPGGLQEVRAVNESGLYALIFTSRKPEAQRFRRWVTGEVLPSIRKTGGYSMGDHARRVRDVFDVAGTAVKARGLRGPARDAAVRAVVQEIAPDLLHLVPEPSPRQTPDQPDPGELVAVVRDWLQQHGAALPELSEVRALVLTRPEGARPQVSDFRRTQPAEYVISPYTFAEVICSGLDARKVALALRDAGHLRHEADRCTITQRLPGEGGKVKVYAIKPEILH
ncbi:BRO-N domain-containing protein [Sphaerotilus montanus]|uniref:BRO-N domain-containing protein n=1 Tax=Sphaerotilus montanus TaxID=522889 RepID=UPI003FA21A44